MTESKGAFLVGGMLVVSLYVIGRPKFVQIIAIVIAMTMGVGALSFLPRMSDMEDLRSDEGVQGRLLAWEIARGVSKTKPTGEGWGEFVALIDWKVGSRTIKAIPKATHSSYVKISADLGRYGLFIYLAGLWCVAHTLLSFRPANDMEDCCRRILWVLLLSTIISGWMINREYHTEHFLLIAAGAALHRLAKARELGVQASDNAEIIEDEMAHSSLQSKEIIEVQAAVEQPHNMPVFSLQDKADEVSMKPLWNKFGLIDITVCFTLTCVTFWVWDYILKNI